jgi:hypothetical protein
MREETSRKVITQAADSPALRQTRREALKTMARCAAAAVLALGAGLLASRGQVAVCDRDLRCNLCPELSGCPLPAAALSRRPGQGRRSKGSSA